MRGLAALVAVLAALSPSPAFCQTPVRSEQFVWDILAYNGQDYTATFTTEASDTMYLISGADSFISAKKTFVYWWPATAEWKTDPDTLEQQFPGSLELRGRGGATRRIPLREYTYYNVSGEYELNWAVVTGDAAREEVRAYDAYFSAAQAYDAQAMIYQEKVDAMSARIEQLRKEGKDFTALLGQLKAVPVPTPPVLPRDYVVPPARLQEGFILNLPAGEYSLRLLDDDGTVMEGSDMNVVVHDRRRSNGVGFQVIPGDKWTRPETSPTPSSVLYVNGSADLFLRPFYEDEFNDLAYEKTVNNAARGNPHVVKWILIQQIPRATVELDAPGAGTARLSEEPFFVEQLKGSSLGYTIRPWNTQGTGVEDTPTIVAFHVPLNPGSGVIGVSCLDSNGAPLAGSQRQIRVITKPPSPALLLVLALLPLPAMIILLILRARSYREGPSVTG